MTKFLLVTDLDNTLVGDDQALAELNQHLSQHRQVHGTKIVYATGRSLTSYQQLLAQQPLLTPDALVTSVGTEIYYNGSPTPDPTWSDCLAPQWNRDQIVATATTFADLVPQPSSEQRPFKVSYFLHET
ncbi:MAG: HAD-IIB family hydrolase, partial [Leptolyngbyaceae bacterium]|nr:HAD-IIB family hydrolase [Leptolyngbyaceae bacterium]